jgi:hypothetical protein
MKPQSMNLEYNAWTDNEVSSYDDEGTTVTNKESDMTLPPLALPKPQQAARPSLAAAIAPEGQTCRDKRRFQKHVIKVLLGDHTLPELEKDTIMHRTWQCSTRSASQPRSGPIPSWRQK